MYNRAVFVDFNISEIQPGTSCMHMIPLLTPHAWRAYVCPTTLACKPRYTHTHKHMLPLLTPSSGGIHPDRVTLCSFRSKSDADRWRVFTDAAFGGSSNAKLELGQDSKARASVCV